MTTTNYVAARIVHHPHRAGLTGTMREASMVVFRASRLPIHRVWVCAPLAGVVGYTEMLTRLRFDADRSLSEVPRLIRN